MLFYGGYGASAFSDYLVFILVPLIISIWASANVRNTFGKYSKVVNQRGYTAADVARQILNHAGIYNVRVERIDGELTDHFDPRENVVRLSDSVYSSASVAALGVAAHEVGHAIQHAKGYVPIKIRTAIVPIVSLASNLAMPMFFLGLFLGLTPFAWIGVIMFAAVVLFSLVTLPVEFNASRRALANLEGANILAAQENEMAKKVLSAAAMTYVASSLAALGQLLYWISRTRSRD